MFNPEEIVAYTEKESWMFNGMLRTEYRVLVKHLDLVRRDYDIPSYRNLAWGDLFVLEQRRAEMHNDKPAEYHPWRMFEVSEELKDIAECVPPIATVTHPELRAMVEVIEAARAAEAAAAKKAEAERLEAERVAQAARELERESQACFGRMLRGTDRNQKAAKSWQALIARVQCQPPAVFKKLKADPELAKKQDAVINETRIPQKRKAIRLAVEYVAKIYGI